LKQILIRHRYLILPKQLFVFIKNMGHVSNFIARLKLIWI